MGFLAGIAILSIFLGFLFSPKGTDNQTSVKNGCLYLFVAVFVLFMIGGIVGSISNKPKTKQQRLKEYMKRHQKRQGYKSNPNSKNKLVGKTHEEINLHYLNEKTKELT